MYYNVVKGFSKTIYYKKCLIISDWMGVYMNNVFIVGSLNIDLIFSMKRIPEAGETMHSDDFCMLPGGKGANQAVACALMGATTYMIGNVGSDLFGDIISKSLKENQVKIDYVNIAKEKSSGVACILLNNGDNRIILDHGANQDTSYEQVKSILNRYAKKDDVLLTQLEVPLDTVTKTLELAKKIGMKTILNPAPAHKLSDEIYKYIDVLIPNEIEAEMITGINSSSSSFDKCAIEHFTIKGVKEVVITKGFKGSVYGDNNCLISVKPFEVKVVDTTGAGDAYVGAIASQVAKGLSVKESLDYANASSALAVTKFGAQGSMPRLKEVEEFLRRK